MVAAVPVDQAEPAAAAELAAQVELVAPVGLAVGVAALAEPVAPAEKVAARAVTRGGTGGKTGGGTTGGSPGRVNNPGAYNFNSPYNQPRTIVPPFPQSASTNQQILAALAEGTGGFTIFNTNDLLGGLGRIGREQNEFYILGYVPKDTPEGTCHTLKVKMNRGGTNVRSRSGYCNVKTSNSLEGKPLEKQLESRATGTQTGSIHGGLQAPYFYTSANVARVNLAMEIPADTVKFDKDKGKYHAN